MSNFETISTDRLDPRDRMNQLPRLLRLYGFGMPRLAEDEHGTVQFDNRNQGRMFTRIEYTEVHGLHCARIKGSAYGRR